MTYIVNKLKSTQTSELESMISEVKGLSSSVTLDVTMYLALAVTMYLCSVAMK